MFEKYNEKARRALFFARYEASKLGSKVIESEHLLLGILREGEDIIKEIFARFNVKPEDVRREIEGDRIFVERISSTAELPLSEESKKILAYASHEAESMMHPYVGTEHLLIGLLRVDGCVAGRLLTARGFNLYGVREETISLIKEREVSKQKKELPFLAEYSRDLTQLAMSGTFDPLIGRDKEVEGIIHELRENPDLIIFIDEIHSLIGAGSAEGSLDAANILKPALSRGEVSCIGATTLKEYRKYIEKDRSLLRRFQAIQVTAPTELETFEILEGVKERYEQFHKVHYLPEAIRTAVYQSNRYITDRFFPDKAIDILDEAGAKVKLKRVADTQNLRKLEIETRQIVKEMKKAISDKDFEKAVFLREREIELKEEIERTKAQTAERSDATQEVTRRDIEEIISSWTGIPVASLAMEEAEKLLHMEDALRRRIVGQDAAIIGVSKAIRRSRLGVNNPNRPMGSFIFLGPSGVGKTEVARRLAEFLFETQKALVRFDMSEYMEKHAVSKLIGSPPGYVGHEEGGQLTEKIRRNPYSVILFDEIEKAHPDIANLLLQILEDGILTDAYGNIVDFKNTLIIMTSNIGTKHLVNRSRMGFGGSREIQSVKELEDLVLKELKRDFSPEFINRIDETIVFHMLARPELAKICRLLIDDVNTTLAP